MPKSGLKHTDVGAELTRTEWESEESHEVVHGTGFPSSPVERQLFYRDDEHRWYIYSGTEWVWLGGGGMEVHGNEYHDPDFASEADLSSHAVAATGVHGAGSDYLCGAKSSGIKARDFVRGFTPGKLLKGSGADANPVEISGWEKVAEVVAGSNLDYIDFTSLDGNTDLYYLLFGSFRNSQSSSAAQRLYVNGDYTAANYYAEYIECDNSTVSAGRLNDSYLGGIPANDRLIVMAFITRDPDGYFRFYTFTTRYTGSAVRIQNWAICKTATITNITSLRISSSYPGAIGQNSFVILCKPRTA